MIQLRSFDPADSYHVILDGDVASPTYLEPLAVINVPTSRFRWSQNPAKPTIQYGIPVADPGNAVEEDDADASFVVGDDDDLIIEYDAMTGQIVRQFELPFNKQASSKTSIAFVNGREYLTLLGRPKDDPNGPVKLFVVDLNFGAGESPVVAEFDVDAPTAGLGAVSNGVVANSLRFAPDGSAILLAYNTQSDGRVWRLLDVNIATGTISGHALPALNELPFFTPGAAGRSQGFMQANWAHPAFALGSNGTDAYVVGGAGNFSGRDVPGVQTFAGNTHEVGSVLAYNVETKVYRSLNDSTPGNDPLRAEHVFATNHQNPGYIIASFLTEAGQTGTNAGELVAFSLEDPEGVNGSISIVHHRTNAEDTYHAEIHGVMDPSGTRLLYSTSWGAQQSIVASFVAELNLP